MAGLSSVTVLLRSRSSSVPGCRSLAVLALFAVALLPCAVEAQRVWVEQGPGPNTDGQVENITDDEVVGAVHTLAAHPSNADILYAGAVNGGIWMTTNATSASPTWVRQLGLDQSHSIGAVAFDPSDATNQTLVAGSGRFSSFLRRGGARVGVWRTTDGGATWTLLPGAAGLNISGVAPRGATIVASANTADATANRGIWRSTDTGGIWVQISGAAGSGLPAGASFDLASDPSNDARLFTNAGANGIYRSTDTGATWTKVSDAAIDALLTANTEHVRISVGSNNNVYVAIANDDGTGNESLVGLFRSGDGGGTWTALDQPTTTESGVAVGIHPGGQGNVHLSLAADPSNDNVVYIGGDRQPFLNEFTTGACPCFPNSIGANDYTGRLFRVDSSQPAGSQATHLTHSNTTSNSAPHADSRDMAIDANGDLVESDDGGVYRRTSPLANTGDWFSVNGDLRVTELHDVAWDANAKIVIGGAQDTGTPEQESSGGPRWRSVSTADGGDVGVDDTGAAGVSNRFSSNQRLGSFRMRTYDASNTLTSQTFPALTVVGGGNPLVRQFTTPIGVNGVNPTQLIIGGSNSVYESLDQGATISEIGVGIVVNANGRDPIAYGATGNANMLYVGSRDSVFVRPAAAPAALASATAYPGAGTGRWVVDLVMDPGDPQTAFVIDPTNVYTTSDAGATWTNITGDLMTQTPGTLRSIAYSTADASGAVIVGGDNGVYMADGPAFTTWTPVGSGLPRVPAYDLEYDVTDEVLVAGLFGAGAWAVSLADRPAVDVALVLDLSGSMASPACSTCAPKLQVLKDAVEIFLQLWTVFAVPGDQLALNYFNTNITEFLSGGNALFPVVSNTPALIADVQGRTTSGLTSMGGGIQTAVNRLTDATRPRHVILFTDGMQNVNPMVNTSTFEIENEAGRTNSNVNPTTPATDLDTALGIKVNTIGVGATPAFENLLDDIATQTDGLFKLTIAPDADLRRFYVEELIDVLRDFSPQLLAYRYGTLQGDTAQQVFTTNGSARRVVFKVSSGRNARVLFSVRKDGVDVTAEGSFVVGPFYRIFSIDVPTTASGQTITPDGDWTLLLQGSANARYEVAAIVDEAQLDYEFDIVGSDHVVGDPLPVRVRVSLAGQPIGDATVTAEILAPGQSLGTLLSTWPTPSEPSGFVYETAATAAQRKFELLLQNDSFQQALTPTSHQITLTHSGGGTYSGAINATQSSGAYRVRMRVRGQHPQIGTYERTEIRTVTFRFGAPDVAASKLLLLSREEVSGGRRYRLSVRPVDRHGNYLGPDYGQAIRVTFDGVEVTDVTDRLDGSYVFETVSGVVDPIVTVTVMEEPLYSGPLAGLPSPSEARFGLSAHAGVTAPVTGFGSSASAGFLWEVDVELRLSPSVGIEGVFGRYDFSTFGTLSGATLYLKGYLPAVTGRWFGAAGPGLFKRSGASSDLGLSGATGYNLPLGGGLEAEFGAAYTHVFDSGGLGFLSFRAGLKVIF